MATDTGAGSAPTIDHKAHADFFRQSGWLMLAGLSGGAMTFAVHLLNKGITDAEYSIFITLIAATACIPAMPLQMVFTQQAASALATDRQRQLTGMMRMAWLWTTVLWLAGAGAVWIFQSNIVTRWGLPSAAGLWVTMLMMLVSIWLPLFSGVLQGRQDFFWVGWSTILSGIARLAGGALFVLAIHGGATGLMTGACIGVAIGVGICIVRTRDLWSGMAESFDAKSTFREVLPLMFGFGASQFLFTSDSMFVKSFFTPEAMKPYGVAGTLARGILYFVMPMAAVMFPKLVHSHARAEKSNLFNIVVIGTGVFAIASALGLWLVGPLVIRIVFKSSDINSTMALLPWYAGAMVPLALANVLVNDLLARGRYIVVPFMVILAVAYGFTMPVMLAHYPNRLEVALQTLAVFTSLLFGVCAFFRWVKKS